MTRRLVLLLALLAAGPAEAAIAVASGTQLPIYRSAGALGASATTCTPAAPSGLAAGDIILVVAESEGRETISLSTANSFVEIPDSPQAGHDGDGVTENPENRIAVFWKRAAGADSMPVVADSGDHTTCRAYAFRNAIASGDPWDVTAGGNDSNANDTSAVIPGDTTTVANTLVVLIQGSSNNATATTNCGAVTNADLANITERTDGTNTINLGGGHCLITGEKAAAGSYADSTLTMSATTYKGAISIALKGATGDYISSAQATAAGTITIPSMPTGGSDRFLFVGAGNSAATAMATSSVVRGGSENLTEQWDDIGTNFESSGHTLTAPAEASASIVVTFASAPDEMSAGSIAFTGVDQGSPIGTPCTAVGATTSSTVTCAADATDWLVDMSWGYGATHTVGADQTSRWAQEGVAGALSGGSSTQLGSVAGDVMSWSGYSSGGWAIGAVPLNEAGGAPPTCAQSIALLGVGCR